MWGKSYFKIIIGLLIGLILSLVTVGFMQYYQYDFNIEPTLRFFEVKNQLYWLQTSVVFVLYSWLFFLIGSTLLASFVIAASAYVISEASLQKLSFRGEPLYPSDIYFLKDIEFLLDMVNISMTVFIVTVVMVLSAITLVVLKLRKKELIDKRVRIIGFICTSLLLYQIYNFNMPDNKLKNAFNQYTNWITYSQELNYRTNGVVSGLLYNLKSPAVEKSNSYSKEEITRIYNKYALEAEILNADRQSFLADTNVIYIMNESFSDAHRMEGLTIEGEDSLKNFRNLNGQHGMVLSQTYGGGTANIEFESLTGISMEPLSGNITIPYIQLSQQIKELPSITSIMKSHNHYLTAIHPYSTRMYKRIDNYSSFGFDNLIFESDMIHTEKLEQSPYISDYASYEELKQTMNNTKEKDFVHLVTMQNHMDYDGKYSNVLYSVTGTEEKAEVESYLTGMKHSDNAIAELISYFDTYDEKVLLVFWGDHLPAIYDDEIKDSNGYQKIHETPLFIYDNFSDNVEPLGTISPIYFMNHVMDRVEGEISPYGALLKRMETVLPAFEKKFYLERETHGKENREELRESTQLLLEEYDLIIYDITTGKNYSKELGFYFP